MINKPILKSPPQGLSYEDSIKFLISSLKNDIPTLSCWCLIWNTEMYLYICIAWKIKEKS